MKFKKNIIPFIFIIVNSFLINLTFIDLSLKNLKDKKILFPSVTSKQIFEIKDIDDNFQWVRRSHETSSIFKLSANIYEDKEKNHFQSSRGLSYFLSSLSLNITNNSLYAITLSKLFFLSISLYLFLKVGGLYIKDRINLYIIVILTFVFSNKLFGGVINFYHFIEYFKNISDFYPSNAIDRIPNILISNVFAFSNYYALKLYWINNNYKNLIIFFGTLILTIFITPIIFIVYSGVFFCCIIFIYFKENNLKKFIFKFIILIIVFLLSLGFHYNNLISINDNSLNSPQWTGNFLYDLEIFFGPILIISIFFYKKIKEYFFEITFLLIQFLFFISSFFYDAYLASKINENFIFLNTFISFIILFKVPMLKINDVNKKFLILGFFLFYLYLFLQHDLDFKILFTLIIFPIYILFKYYNNNFYFKYFIFFIFFSYFVFLNNLEYLNNLKKFSFNNEREIAQIELINHINNNNFKKKSIIALDLSILKNLSIHTNTNVYSINITNSNLNFDDLQKRFFDTIYLYGFTVLDLESYLYIFSEKNFVNSSYPISEDDFTDYNNRSILNFIYNFYHHQDITSENEVKKFIKQYDNYLLNKKYKNMYYFDTCLISNYDEKYIKDNSFVYNLIQKKPIFETDQLKLFNCEY